MSNGEPWDFFKTIENTAKGLEATEAKARENRAILFLIFWLAFAAFHESTPHIARASKDDIMRMLKSLGLSQQLLNILEDDMLKLCETFETLGRR